MAATTVAQMRETKGTMPVMLVIGDLERWRAHGRTPPNIAGFHFAGLADLNATLLSRLRPDVILSGLVQQSFDVLDVAASLQQLRFVGRYRVVTGTIPNPDLIVAEVRNIAPMINFAFLTLNLG